VAEACKRFADEVEASRDALVRFACGMTNNLTATNSPAHRQLPSANVERPAPRALFCRDPTRLTQPAVSQVPEPPDWVLTTPREWLEKLQLAERTAGREMFPQREPNCKRSCNPSLTSCANRRIAIGPAG